VSYLLSGAPWQIGHGGPLWTLMELTPAERRAGAVLRYDGTTSDDRAWQLTAWSTTTDDATDDAARRLINRRRMRWTLSRFGPGGTQHEVGTQLDLLEAVRRAGQLLDEATSPQAVIANEAGEYCARGSDPRHNVTHCPGYHT
jgi:hypothetical protein